MFIEENLSYNPFEYHKRETLSLKNIGRDNLPVVISDLSDKKKIYLTDLKNAGYIFDTKNNDWKNSLLVADYIYVGNSEVKIEFYDKLNLLANFKNWKDSYINKSNVYPLFSVNEYLSANIKSETLNFVKINPRDLNYIKDIKIEAKIVLF